MRFRRFMVPLVAMGLLLSTSASALAATEKASDFIRQGSELSVRQAETDGVSALAAYTSTVQVWREYHSLVGLLVARHDSWTTWTWGGGYLYSSPKAIDVDWYTAPLNNYKSHTKTWDWYTVGQGGTGRSNTQVSFVFGVPTPWGPVGSSYSSRIFTNVNGSGGYSYF